MHILYTLIILCSVSTLFTAPRHLHDAQRFDPSVPAAATGTFSKYLTSCSATGEPSGRPVGRCSTVPKTASPEMGLQQHNKPRFLSQLPLLLISRINLSIPGHRLNQTELLTRCESLDRQIYSRFAVQIHDRFCLLRHDFALQNQDCTRNVHSLSLQRHDFALQTRDCSWNVLSLSAQRHDFARKTCDSSMQKHNWISMQNTMAVLIRAIESSPPTNTLLPLSLTTIMQSSNNSDTTTANASAAKRARVDTDETVDMQLVQQIQCALDAVAEDDNYSNRLLFRLESNDMQDVQSTAVHINQHQEGQLLFIVRLLDKYAPTKIAIEFEEPPMVDAFLTGLYTTPGLPPAAEKLRNSIIPQPRSPLDLIYMGINGLNGQLAADLQRQLGVAPQMIQIEPILRMTAVIRWATPEQMQTALKTVTHHNNSKLHVYERDYKKYTTTLSIKIDGCITEGRIKRLLTDTMRLPEPKNVFVARRTDNSRRYRGFCLVTWRTQAEVQQFLRFDDKLEINNKTIRMWKLGEVINTLVGKVQNTMLIPRCHATVAILQTYSIKEAKIAASQPSRFSPLAMAPPPKYSTTKKDKKQKNNILSLLILHCFVRINDTIKTIKTVISQPLSTHVRTQTMDTTSLIWATFILSCLIQPCQAVIPPAVSVVTAEETSPIEAVIKDTLCIVALNIAGNLIKKRETIRETIKKWNADIIFLSETWMTEGQWNKDSNECKLIMKEFDKYEVKHTAAIRSNQTKTAQECNETLKTKENEDEEQEDKSDNEGEQKKPGHASGGIIALISKKLADRVTEQKSKKNTVLKLKVRSDEQELFVWGIYAPAERKEKQKFWSDIKNEVVQHQEKHGNNNLLIIGDCNVAPEPKIDRHEYKGEKTVEVKAFRELTTDSMTDSWRELNKEKTGYTYISGWNSMSRIDLALTDAELHKRNVRSCEIIASQGSITTDHFPVKITLWTKMKMIKENEQSEERRAANERVNQQAFQNKAKREKYQTLLNELLNEYLARHKNDGSTYENDVKIDVKQLKNIINNAITAPGSIGKKSFDPKVHQRKQRDLQREEYATIRLLKKCNQALMKRFCKVDPISNNRLTKLGKLIDKEYPEERKLAVGEENQKRDGEVQEDMTQKLSTEEWWKIVKREKRKAARKLQMLLKKRLHDEVQENVRVAKALQETNPKKFWRKVNVNKNNPNTGINALRIQLGNESDSYITADPHIINKVLKEKWSKLYKNSGIINSWKNVPWLQHTNKWYRETLQWSKYTDKLTKEFTSEELDAALQTCANQKATTEEPTEVYKYMTKEGKQCLLDIMNKAYKTAKLPKEWTVSVIRLLPKTGDKFDPMNYRPITIGEAALKIMMKMLTVRITEQVETTGILLNEQGGFRIGRNTFDKINSIIKLLGSAKMNKTKKQFIYILFVDIKKCYDSVNHSLILRTLEAMGYPKQFTEFMTELYGNNSVSIIGANGTSTEKFTIERGIRQGDPSSCILINLLFDPILRYVLETPEKQNNYATGGTADQTLLGFVDDMALITWSKEKLRRTTEKLVNTLADAGLEIAIDHEKASKTTIMTNDPTYAKEKVQRIQIQKSEKNVNTAVETIPKQEKEHQIPIITGKSSYKYLGYWINVDVDWDQQLATIRNNAKRHIAYLRKRCYGAATTVRIVNQIIIPSVEYRTASMPWGTENLIETLADIDKRLAGLINKKYGIRYTESAKYLHLSTEQGGAGLKQAIVQAKIAMTRSMINHGLESHDPQCKAIVTHQNKGYEKNTNEILTTYGMKIEQTTGKEFETSRMLPNETNKEVKRLKQGELLELTMEEIQNVARKRSTHEDAKTAAVLITREIENRYKGNEIVHFLNAKGKLPTIMFPKDEAQLFSDASLKDGQEVAYAVFHAPPYNGKNYTWKGVIKNTGTVVRGEVLALIHAVLVAVRYKTGAIYSDSMSAISYWNETILQLKNKNDVPNKDLRLIIATIKEQMEERKQHIEIRHVMAHSKDHHDEAEKRRRSDINRQRFGEKAEEITRGNQRADELAGSKEAQQNIVSLPHFMTTRKIYHVLDVSTKQQVNQVADRIHADERASQMKKVSQLKKFEWYKEKNIERIDVKASNYIFTMTKPELEYEQKIIHRARRQLLPEKQYLITHKHIPTLIDHFGLPKDDKCPICKQPETQSHCATQCSGTKEIQQETFDAVCGIIKEKTSIGINRIPNWFNAAADKHDVPSELAEELKAFPKIHGALGIIPKALQTLVKQGARSEATPEDVRDKDAAKKENRVSVEDILREIHQVIVKGYVKCWKERCKKAKELNEGKEIKPRYQRDAEEQAATQDKRQQAKERMAENAKKRQEERLKKRQENEKKKLTEKEEKQQARDLKKAEQLKLQEERQLKKEQKRKKLPQTPVRTRQTTRREKDQQQSTTTPRDNG